MNLIQNNIIICYDITSNKLRNKIHKAMKDYGKRLQRSVYLCQLDDINLNRCRDRLTQILNKNSNAKNPGDGLFIIKKVDPDDTDCLLGEKITQDDNYRIY